MKLSVWDCSETEVPNAKWLLLLHSFELPEDL